jgi:hypothetical protein
MNSINASLILPASELCEMSESKRESSAEFELFVPIENSEKDAKMPVKVKPEKIEMPAIIESEISTDTTKSDDESTNSSISLKFKFYNCKTCKKSFTRKNQLDKHLTSHHKPIERNYSCDICDKKFSYKIGLTGHFDFRHQFDPEIVKKYACPSCPRSFNWQGNLRRHTIMEHDTYGFDVKPSIENVFCAFCDKAFINDTHLTLHFRIVHKPTIVKREILDEKHECPSCPRLFDSRKEAKEHFNLNHIRKPEPNKAPEEFCCNFCGKIYVQEFRLRNHVKICEGAASKKRKLSSSSSSE